ncbi:MAG TPA: hypothetical protein DEP66_00195 [Acidimicrobiaceae bacterium]|nr:hypothetical protein [Acidimicrobiaceae bacterium]HCB36668.1 hypothetical protein [Acidimicrobiaceae bacterium]
MWSDAHTALAWVVAAGNGAVGVWALAALRAPRLAGTALWWSVAGAYAAVFVQLALGVVVLQTSGVETPAFHVFYGVCAALTVAVLYGYRHQLAQRRLLFFGLGSLFVMGLSVRAMFVAG